MEQSERLKLTNSPPQSTTWIYRGQNGRLTVEWYDYSEEAENSLGGDVAFLLHVDEEGKRQMWALLDTAVLSPVGHQDKDLLQRIQQRFGSYHEIKSWLQEHRIPFEAEFDSSP